MSKQLKKVDYLNVKFALSFDIFQSESWFAQQSHGKKEFLFIFISPNGISRLKTRHDCSTLRLIAFSGNFYFRKLNILEKLLCFALEAVF
jgi:hypothetical protein